MKHQAHFFTYNGDTKVAACKCGWKRKGVQNAAGLRRAGYAHIKAVSAAISRMSKEVR
jgi:hypothetical protein